MLKPYLYPIKRRCVLQIETEIFMRTLDTSLGNRVGYCQFATLGWVIAIVLYIGLNGF